MPFPTECWSAYYCKKWYTSIICKWDLHRRWRKTSWLPSESACPKAYHIQVTESGWSLSTIKKEQLFVSNERARYVAGLYPLFYVSHTWWLVIFAKLSVKTHWEPAIALPVDIVDVIWLFQVVFQKNPLPNSSIPFREFAIPLTSSFSKTPTFEKNSADFS